MYSSELKKHSISNFDSSYLPSSIAIEKELDGFCTSDDLIGVPCKIAMNYFLDYCAKNGKSISVSYTTFGIAVCKKFGLKTKSARYDGAIVRVYYKKP